MSDESVATIADDQSHYEISLTAGQAFIAFVLLLLSLAASFAFGLMIGKSQGDERLVVRKEPSVVTEASVMPKKQTGKIVELGVADSDFKAPETTTVAATTSETPVISETTAPAAAPVAATPVTSAGEGAGAPLSTPVYAQLLSTGDQKTAEALAAKLINGGFNAAYVERTTNDKGPIFRVRVKFSSEADARAAESKLKEFSKEVWITK